MYNSDQNKLRKTYYYGKSVVISIGVCIYIYDVVVKIIAKQWEILKLRGF